MAVQHANFDDGNTATADGRALRAAVTNLENGLNQFQAQTATLVQMKDNGAVTTYIVGQYRFDDLAAAQLAVGEIEAAAAALAGIEVTLRQLFNRLR